MVRFLALAALAGAVVACQPAIASPHVAAAYAGSVASLPEVVNALGDPLAVRVVTDSASAAATDDLDLDRAQRFLADRHLLGVVGHATSRGTLAVAALYDSAEVPLVVPTATSRLLRTGGPWLFRLVPDNGEQARFLVAFVRDTLRARRLAIFYVNDEYGQDLRRALRDALGSDTTLRIADQVPFDAESDLGLLVEAALGRESPDVVVVIGAPRGAGVIAREVYARRPALPVVLTDGAMALDEVREALAGAVPPLYGVTYWLPEGASPQAEHFVRLFRERTGRAPTASDALAADALRLFDAAVRDGHRSRAGVARYFRSLGRQRAPFYGFTGPLAFGPGARRPLLVARVTPGPVTIVARRSS